jgi:hypothetical protein
MTDIIDTGKRCSGCAFWMSLDRKTGVCAILVEDDRSPFTPPADGYCSEHKADTMTASAIRRHTVSVMAENARLREALVSFAEASKMLPSALADHEFLTLFNDASLDTEGLRGDYDASPITAGHLRRAAAALKGGVR